MDDPTSRRRLADDPTFLAEVSELDRGLLDGDLLQGHPPRRQAMAGQPRPAAPPGPQPPNPAVSAPPSLPPTLRPAGRSSLLDLFPPLPSSDADVSVAERSGDAADSVPGRSRDGSGTESGPFAVRPPGPPRSVGPRLPRIRTAPVPSPPSADDRQLYESFYGLHANPFKLEPDPCFLYHSSSHDRVAQDVMTALRRRAAAILVTGESGIGKTMLCRTIVDQLDRRTLTSFVTDSRVSAESLLRTVLVDFGVISRGRAQKADHHELTDALRSFLASLATLQASAVLIVDDAHTLAMPALEQVRLLSELGAADRPLQVLLVGDPDLATTLRRAELKALDRRIALRCRLEPLARVEVAGYVMHRVAVAGTRARINFDDGALARVFELSDGVPRVVNMICDRALTLGQRTAASVIQRELIDQAATDIEVRRARGERHGLVRALAAALMFLLLMILGAAASAWIFSDVIRQTIAEWRSIPPAPESPVRRLPAPLAPLPMPEGMPER